MVRVDFVTDSILTAAFRTRIRRVQDLTSPQLRPMIAHVRPAATQGGLLLRRENHCRITLPDRCPGGGGAAAAHPACTPAPCSETPPSSAGRQPRQLSLELMDDILGAFEVPSPAPKEMHQLKKKRKR